MLTQIETSNTLIRGISLGGLYTAFHLPQLSVLLDIGVAARSFASANTLLLSHGHPDHMGALATLLGIRGLSNPQKKLRIFCPKQTAENLTSFLEKTYLLNGHRHNVDVIGVDDGEQVQLGGKMWFRAFRTFHRVPSLGFQLFEKVDKLRPEFTHLPGQEIARRRKQGEDMLYSASRLQIAYATDTLVKVLDKNPSLYQTKILIIETTFLDERKPLSAVHEGCHIHLDEIIERADNFCNESIVLMHFSQLYSPSQVVSILNERCPPALRKKIVPFVPQKDWFG